MIDQHFGSAAARSPASEYEITTARPKDVPLLPAIELAAAMLLVGHAPEAALAETTSQEDHDDAQRHGHLWVALMDDTPVGFAHVDVIEAGVAHLEELDVHPEMDAAGSERCWSWLCARGRHLRDSRRSHSPLLK
jgi:hypothetical protein